MNVAADLTSRPGSRRAVFISYRRDDSSGFAGRLHHSVIEHFGTSRVFRDVDSIEPGIDFVRAIEASLAACGALVVVIGREWLDARAADGSRRLDNPRDLVRLEVATALARGMLVIPVLVEGATMPSAGRLPADLADLARRNAIEVSDSRWAFDVSRLVSALEKGLPPEPWWSKVRRLPSRRGWATTVAVLAVLGVLGVSLRAMTSPGSSPSVMTGGFNVEVAEFTAVDGQGRSVASAEAPALADSVYRELATTLAVFNTQGLDVQVRGPADNVTVGGRTAEQRARSAESRARKTRADLIVYGTLRLDDGAALQPEFFLSERTLVGSEELAGQHDMGSALSVPGDITRNPVAAALVRDQLVERAAAFAQFAIGLGYYALDRLPEAFERFGVAADAPSWDQQDGKEVVHLFLGNVALKQRDFAAGLEQYRRALSLNPDYGRALLGIGEATFQLGRGDCEVGQVDAPAMETALDSFVRAGSARVQPQISLVPVRAALGRARVHACVTQALVADRTSAAVMEYRTVIDAADRETNEAVRELTAEAYAGLGYMSLPRDGAAEPDKQYRAALGQYQRALDLTRRDDRRAFFNSMKGFLYGRLGQLDKAEDAYDRAIRLERDPSQRQHWQDARAKLREPS